MKTLRITADNKDMKTTYGIIWRILNELDLALDLPDYCARKELTPQKFRITENRFCNYLSMLQSAGYVGGVRVTEDITGEQSVDYSGIRITLEGIQFLLENSTMRKLADVAEKIGLKVAEAGTDFLLDRIAK